MDKKLETRKDVLSVFYVGGDQGLLNSFFSDWATKDIKKRLPFVYNVVSQAFYSYRPAMKQYVTNITRLVSWIRR